MFDITCASNVTRGCRQLSISVVLLAGRLKFHRRTPRLSVSTWGLDIACDLIDREELKRYDTDWVWIGSPKTARRPGEVSIL